MKKYHMILLSVLWLILGCEYQSPTTDYRLDIKVELEHSSNSNYPNDIYYYFELDTNHWQSLYRIQGTVYKNDIPVENIKVHWESSHYWVIGDTLGYIVQSGLTSDLIYVNYDTSYVTWFDGFEVPTINHSSYSDENGNVSTMFAPVQNMISDTITVWYFYYDQIDSIKIILK